MPARGAFTPAHSRGWYAAENSNASVLGDIAGRAPMFRRITCSLLRVGRYHRSSVSAVRPAVSQHRDATASRGLAGHSARHACSAPLISTAAAHTGFSAALQSWNRGASHRGPASHSYERGPNRSRLLPIPKQGWNGCRPRIARGGTKKPPTGSDELHRIAKALRVDRVMRPYLEILVV